jgi:predicted nucleotidyltransferase
MTPQIDAAMRVRIDAALDAVAREEDVRILLAIESGSRAWGFPSRDSDYDVRFLYDRPLRRYLSIAPARDVIERPIDDALDLNGWDVTKALQLLVKSNAVLLEWLASPVRYRAVPEEAGRIAALATETADLGAIAFHYDQLARRSLTDVVAQDAVRLKTYCYALRPALALLWLRRHRRPPPMDLPRLVDGLALAEPVRSAIAALVTAKASATERDATPRLPVLDTLIGEALSEPAERPRLADRAPALAAADALFASLVLDRTS